MIIGTTSNYDVLKQMGLADNFSYKTRVPYLDDTSQVMVVLKVSTVAALKYLCIWKLSIVCVCACVCGHVIKPRMEQEIK